MRFWMIAVAVIAIGLAAGAFAASRTSSAPSARLAITPAAGGPGQGASGNAQRASGTPAAGGATAGGGNGGQRAAGGNATQRGAGGGAPRANSTPGAGAATRPTTDNAGTPGRSVNGSVAAASDDALQIETQQGATSVKLTPDTRIQRLTPASAADLQPGDRVIVAGERMTDGTFVATSVQIVPAR